MCNSRELSIRLCTEDVNYSKKDFKFYCLPSLRSDKTLLRDKDAVKLIVHDFGHISVESIEFPIKMGKSSGHRILIVWADCVLDPKFIFDNERKAWVLEEDWGISFAEVRN